MGVDFREFEGTTFIGPNGLCHFGTKGMHWGVRRYQNSDGSLTPAGRARYRAGSEANATRSDRKFAAKINRGREKARAEALEKARIAKAEKKQHDEDKERVLREGTAKEVLKYANEISNKELNDALNRIKWTNELNSISKQEMEKGWKAVDDVMKKVGMINNWTSTGINAYKNADQVKKIFDDLSKSLEDPKKKK